MPGSQSRQTRDRAQVGHTTTMLRPTEGMATLGRRPAWGACGVPGTAAIPGVEVMSRPGQPWAQASKTGRPVQVQLKRNHPTKAATWWVGAQHPGCKDGTPLAAEHGRADCEPLSIPSWGLGFWPALGSPWGPALFPLAGLCQQPGCHQHLQGKAWLSEPPHCMSHRLSPKEPRRPQLDTCTSQIHGS